jgi:hypothetical protein
MDIAIQMLRLFEKRFSARIKNTGWKSGFGREVAKALPIDMLNVQLAMTTDGCEICLQRVAGNASAFDESCVFVMHHSYAAAD